MKLHEDVVPPQIRQGGLQERVNRVIHKRLQGGLVHDLRT